MTRGVDERKNRERLLHGAIDSIEGAVTEETIASSMGLRGKSELRKYYGELYQPIEFSKDDWDKEVYRAINKGEDLQFDLTLGFRDAIFGCEKTIRIQHLEVSSNSNVVPTIKTLRVNVPVGVDSGTRLRVVGEGDVSRSNGDPGDLYICLTVLLTEEGFRREGTNIFSELIITTEEASQGAKVDVLTIHGEEKLRLPKQTSNGKCFVLKGRGVRKLASPTERGDHIVQVKFK
ncbi:MAG: hypothetical protein KME11_19465 [Timaviella obliquedivisa GSE-PSE-MK23-08B]|jgi:DnaJ-class molecular chaperone|nr:hypothetical protein [Timaviella obliquedivisa GSE-PSE-MK23-08B]